MIIEQLISWRLMPISVPSWNHFEINLTNCSTNDEYTQAKKIIRENVSKGKGGLYILEKGDTVLYIGESKSNIQNRLIRHINKIYLRKDSRSDFFKLPEHIGDLTIYFYVLPPGLLKQRKFIESLLTTALEPEYINWEFMNKFMRLKECFVNEDF